MKETKPYRDRELQKWKVWMLSSKINLGRVPRKSRFLAVWTLFCRSRGRSVASADVQKQEIFVGTLWEYTHVYIHICSRAFTNISKINSSTPCAHPVPRPIHLGPHMLLLSPKEKTGNFFLFLSVYCHSPVVVVFKVCQGQQLQHH